MKDTISTDMDVADPQEFLKVIKDHEGRRTWDCMNSRWRENDSHNLIPLRIHCNDMADVVSTRVAEPPPVLSVSMNSVSVVDIYWTCGGRRRALLKDAFGLASAHTSEDYRWSVVDVISVVLQHASISRRSVNNV